MTLRAAQKVLTLEQCLQIEALMQWYVDYINANTSGIKPLADPFVQPSHATGESPFWPCAKWPVVSDATLAPSLTPARAAAAPTTHCAPVALTTCRAAETLTSCHAAATLSNCSTPVTLTTCCCARTPCACGGCNMWAGMVANMEETVEENMEEIVEENMDAEMELSIGESP
ncbi:hypothetical protein VTN02DRAFT_1452 [Thermoascus thermophilus]